jgi:hypothetical protein
VHRPGCRRGQPVVILGRKLATFMLRIVSHLLHWVTDRRCPSCGGTEVRRSAGRNSFEAVLLPILLARPFRCQHCGIRFYGLALRKRVLARPGAKAMSDLPQDWAVLVYGRRKDEEPFREETNVHLLNLRGGFITLATSVEPGQQLILMNVATEEDQRCRVAFVGQQLLGRTLIGIQFSQPPWELWRIAAPPCSSLKGYGAGALDSWGACS